jgi:hypothetical protein
VETYAAEVPIMEMGSSIGCKSHNDFKKEGYHKKVDEILF